MWSTADGRNWTCEVEHAAWDKRTHAQVTVFDNKQWESLCAVMGDPDWSQDEKFSDRATRHKHHDEIDGHIARWSSQRDPYEVMYLLQNAGVAAGPVMDQQDAYDDPHLNEREMFEEVCQEDTGTHRYPGAPFKMLETPVKIRRGPVRLGEDNEYVYRTVLGYPESEYAQLEAEGHISMDYPEHLE